MSETTTPVFIPVQPSVTRRGRRAGLPLDPFPNPNTLAAFRHSPE